jgi:hypothetical protein
VQNKQVQINNCPGNLINQCSNAKKADRNVEIYSCLKGGGFLVETASMARVGDMFREDCNLNHLFHGARVMKGGKLVNEVLTATFDPATLNCVSCLDPHSILGRENPAAICITDQNFIPAMGGSKIKTVLLLSVWKMQVSPIFLV